jgi:hypothetical protein
VKPQSPIPSPVRAPFEVPSGATPGAAAPWDPPRFEVISLDCEITSYAPDDRPLF